eukprot:365562-Chlamydomonas_euryale.AAC.5
MPPFACLAAFTMMTFHAALCLPCRPHQDYLSCCPPAHPCTHTNGVCGRNCIDACARARKRQRMRPQCINRYRCSERVLGAAGAVRVCRA